MYRLFLLFIHLCGNGLGWLARVINIEYARVCRININLVFPELSASEIDKLVRRSMREFGKLTMETLFIWLISGDFFKKQIRHIYGKQHLEEALIEQRGIIFVHPHLGNWEVFNLFLGPYKPHAFYKPINNRFWNSLILKNRERPGTTMISIDTVGVRKAYHVLTHGGILKTLPDQLPDGSGIVMADFFGVPARTGTLLPRMIQKNHPAVICCYARRLLGARGFDIHLVPALAEIYSDDLQESTEALNKSMEQIIRLAPEQYLWGYKRFKYTVDAELYSRNSPVQ
ncbi:MAG: lysophospholipid acyltransferase family protein [Gammaproteobacteria bacterium]|nr:lysophospholipid acyltransferase family protein [Gammaproteobacteria bacterium]